LTGANLSNTYYAFNDANLVGATLRDLNFQNAYSAFGQSNLAGINLSGFVLRGASDYTFQRSNLAGVNWAGGGVDNTNWRWGVGVYANLAGANLSGFNIGMTYNAFIGSNLTGANLAGVIMGDAGDAFNGSNLSGVTSGGILGRDRDFGGDWVLRNGYIYGPRVNLSGANLSGVNLLLYNLVDAGFGGGDVVIDENTKIPSGWTYLHGRFFGPRITLSGANFSGLNLEGVNFEGMTFTNIKIDENTKLPDGWIYFNGNIIGSSGRNEVDISGLNLDGMDLSSMNLRGWRGVGLSGSPSELPAGYNIVNGTLVGPGVNLVGANMANMDLRSYDLTGATIVMINNLGSATLPPDWKKFGDWAVGPGARLHTIAPGGNFAGMNLAGMHLGSGNHPFSGGSNFVGANLAGIDFGTSTHAFWPANLTGANFAGADLRGQSQWHGAMGGVDFSGIISGGILGPDRDWGLWKLIGGYIYGPRVNLSGANLSGVNLLQYNLAGANFGGGGVIVDNDTKIPSGWNYLGGYFFGPNITLSGANFSGLNLEGVNFQGMNFSNIKIDENTKLPAGWTYLGGNLISTNGGGRVNLAGLNLEGANLSGYNMFGWSGSGITGTPETLPEGYAVEKGLLVGPGVIIEDLNLSGFNLSSYNLHGARLTRITSLDQTTLPAEWTKFNYWDSGSYWAAVGPGADLTGTRYLGGAGDLSPNANWSGANLSGVQFYSVNFAGNNAAGLNLAGAQFWSSNFRGANLSGVNFRNANEWSNDYSGVRSGNVLGGNRSLSNYWNVINGYILGPNVNLSGAHLSNMNLAASNLNLHGVQFGGGGVTLGDGLALPSNWVYRDGYVFGPNVNLSGANFSGFNLEGINLTGIDLNNVKVDDSTKLPDGWVNFRGALLDSRAGAAGSRVDFSGSDLGGADLSSFNLSGWKIFNLSGLPSSLPAGYSIINNSVVGPGINFYGADLSSMNLSQVDLVGSDLSYVKNIRADYLPAGWFTMSGWYGGGFGFAMGPGSVVSLGNRSIPSHISVPDRNFAGLQWVEAYYFGQRWDAARTNFAGIDLRRSSVPFYMSYIPDTNLAGANFVGADRPFHGNGTNDMMNANRVNLAGANFAGADRPFYWTDFTGSNLAGIKLGNSWGSGSRFSGVKSGGIEGSDRPMGSHNGEEWFLRGGYIVGPTVNLAGSNLSSLDLRWINLTGANLQGAVGSNINVNSDTRLPSGWAVLNGVLTAL